MERLIKKSGYWNIPAINYESSCKYRNIGSVQYRYTHEYWYDGCKFLIDLHKKTTNVMVEFTTGATCVRAVDLGKKDFTVENIIECFKGKMRKTDRGNTISEVIATFKNFNVELELWEIKLLI